ncbi:MAG TPA: hypothetical protein VJG83_05000 [archaeon]|nr:hypothetical protein [archaeon]
MGPVTLFLVVLIVALVIGNVMLFFLKKPLKPNLSKEVRESGISEPLQEPERGSVNILPLAQKVDLAHRRLQMLENRATVVSTPAADAYLKKKVEKLDNFRSTAESEIIALKEIVEELQKGSKKKAAKKGKATKSASKGPSSKITSKAMHKLIYRSSA